MIDKFPKIPQQEITSTDVLNFASGLNLNGAANADSNSFISSTDVELSPDGFIVPRRTLTQFLANTVGSVYQIYPVIWQGFIYYITADKISSGSGTSGHIIYCKEGDTTWTVAGGSNAFTVFNGGKTEFVRALDTVLILNGTNGDKVAYLSLSTFNVTKYVAIADPVSAMTATFSGGLTGTGSSFIYYAYSYTTTTGETNLSPILTQAISNVRDQWQTLATPGKITLTRPGTAPTGAQYWNLYIALSSQGGTILASDMLQLALQLDLNSATFTDDGSLSINLSGPAPLSNSTAGFRADHGIIVEGNPILFGDPDTPQNIWIGGGGQNALSFANSMGGYKAQPNLGTNFQVSTIIGFRNGQGIPSLTVLFNNTEGLAEQAVLEQQTVTYGNQTFSVWGVVSQHYGAAGVAAADSAINYNGKLLFMSTDGIMMMNTQPLRQNVISTDNVTIKTMAPYIQGILNSAMKTIVGTAWDNRYMFIIPNNGFLTPQQILIMDDNNKVAENDNNGAFYTMNIPAQWIGVISPLNEGAFIYITQGNQSFKLDPGIATYDTKAGVQTPFSTAATGPLIPISPGRNAWQADVQAMFYVEQLVGTITVGVTYRNQNGVLKTKSKTHVGPQFIPAYTGGWGDPQWTYAAFNQIPGWGSSPTINVGAAAVVPQDVRIPVQIDDLMNEAQWWFTTPAGFNSYKLRAVNFEGQNLGVRPDLQ